MAVARMLKTTVIGHRPVMARALEALQHAGVVDVAASELDLPSEELEPEDAARLTVEEHLADAMFVRDFLVRFHEYDAPFSMFVTEKVHVSAERLAQVRFDSRFQRVYRECVTISDRLAQGERDRERLAQLGRDLEPWLELRLEISAWNATEHTAIITGTIPSQSSAAIRQRLRDAVDGVTVEELGPAGSRCAWVVIALKDDYDAVRDVLAAADFAEVSFPGLTDYPAEESARATERIERIDEESTRLRERAEELARGHYHEAVILAQALESRRDALTVRRRIAGTESAFILTGWVPQGLLPGVTEALESFSDAVDVTFDEPSDEDDPPVALDNPPWMRPLELLTDLYGRPSYRGIDPTPLHTPFFLLFFAMCIGDVGYGLMLIGGAWLIKNRLDVGAGVKRFMDLVMMGGVLSMVVGVLLGSYLALPVESLPPLLRSLQILDPVNQIQPFLITALIIGAIQVFFGVFVATYLALKDGDVASAVADHLSIVLLFAMLGITAFAALDGDSGLVRLSLVVGIVGSMLLKGRAVQAALSPDGVAAWDRAAGAVWALTVLGGLSGYALGATLIALAPAGVMTVLGLTVSRSIRRGVVGTLAGAYGVYGLTGFVGDILSYLRLPALGLSGTLVGGVFNILTRLVWSGATPLFERGGGFIVLGLIVGFLGVAVFAVGHVFNVVINLLGAFVHPTRLQFVEFFSKFYEAGGRPFAPLSLRTDGLVLDAGGVGKEGGRVS